MARSPSGFHQRRTAGKLAADSGGVGVEFARPEARAAMNAAPGEPDEPPPPLAPATGSRDWTYPEPPDPAHDGPEPCDTPALYRVETVK